MHLKFTIFTCLLSVLFISLWNCPSTYAADTIRRGVWYDYSGSERITVAKQISSLRNLNINSVHIEISSPITDMQIFADCKSKAPGNLPLAKLCAMKKYIFGFDKWVEGPGREPLPAFIDALQGAGFRVYLMIWPIPTKDYKNSLSNLEAFVTRHPVYGIEIEDEENWGSAYLSPQYGSITQAADELFAHLRAHIPGGVKIGVTTAPRNFLQSQFASDRLVRLADFISFQSYQNVCRDGGDHCPVDQLSGQYAPGVMQDRSVQVLQSPIFGKTTPVVLGLPAYDQSMAPYSGDLNMFIALREALCGNYPPAFASRFDEVSYWSLRNILPKKGEGAYARRILTSCSNTEIVKACKLLANRDVFVAARQVCPAAFR